MPANRTRTEKQPAVAHWQSLPDACFYAFTLLLTLGLLAPTLCKPFRVNDDYRAHFFWLAQLHRPDLFPHDFLTDYWRDFIPPGLVGIYWLLTSFMPGPLISKLLGLAVVSAYLVGSWRLGRALFTVTLPRQLFAAWMAGNGILLRGMLGGLSRGFGPPLQLWFLALLAEGQPWPALACVLLALVLHPVSFVLMGGTFGLWWIWEGCRKARDVGLRRHLALGAVGGVVGLAGFLSLSSHVAGSRTRYGPPLTSAQIAAAPEWGPGGRLGRDLPNGMVDEVISEATARIQPKPFPALQLLFTGVVIAGIAGGLAVARRNNLPHWPVLAAYAAAGLAVYQLACWELPCLYFPNRYLIGPIDVTVGVLVSLAGTSLWAAGSRPGGIRLRRALTLSVAGLVFVGGLAYRPPSAYGTDLRPFQPAARWLREHTSKESMFAAFPSNDADGLIVLAERPCLMTFECDQPVYSGYTDETRRRLRLLFPAIYAFSPEEVRNLARETPARYLVIRRRDLVRGRSPRLYREPHNAEIRKWLAAHRRQPYYWTSNAAPKPVYSDPNFLIFDLSPFTGPPLASAPRPASAAFARKWVNAEMGKW